MAVSFSEDDIGVRSVICIHNILLGFERTLLRDWSAKALSLDHQALIFHKLIKIIDQIEIINFKYIYSLHIHISQIR